MSVYNYNKGDNLKVVSEYGTVYIGKAIGKSRQYVTIKCENGKEETFNVWFDKIEIIG